ncbi:ABC transporter, ATP-binding protein [Pelomyxa schiedti]|nr:ABC transporter, ATP-binding protein [Pelomyxa schiedti]
MSSPSASGTSDGDSDHETHNHTAASDPSRGTGAEVRMHRLHHTATGKHTKSNKDHDEANSADGDPKPRHHRRRRHGQHRHRHHHHHKKSSDDEGGESESDSDSNSNKSKSKSKSSHDEDSDNGKTNKNKKKKSGATTTINISTNNKKSSDNDGSTISTNAGKKFPYVPTSGEPAAPRRRSASPAPGVRPIMTSSGAIMRPAASGSAGVLRNSGISSGASRMSKLAVGGSRGALGRSGGNSSGSSKKNREIEVSDGTMNFVMNTGGVVSQGLATISDQFAREALTTSMVQIEFSETGAHSLSRLSRSMSICAEEEIMGSVLESTSMEVFSSSRTESHPKSLCFSGISYYVKPFRKPQIQILYNISAHVPAGSLIGLMGPSGAGKSTLLDIIAGRHKGGLVEGEIWIDRERPTSEFYKNHTAYVMQDDVFIGELSVRETILFRIRMKCPNLSRPDQESLATVIIHNFNLEKCQNTRVGSEGKRGISGGERRRLSIAVEVVSFPSILFIDEVTSGLDAQNALHVMQSVKNFCATGCTVVCTIHQPRPTIFAMFDKLLLLKDGYLVYYGPSKSAVDFFKQLGFEVPKHEPPADFILDVLAQKNTTEFDHSQKTMNLEQKGYDGASLNKAYSESIWVTDTALPTDLSDEPMGPELGKSFSIDLKYWWIRLLTLSERNWVENIRNYTIVWIRLIFSLILGVVIGGVWFDLSPAIMAMSKRIPPLAFLMIAFSILVMPAMSQVLSSRQLLFRERGFGLYSSLIFFIASCVQHTPINFAMTILVGMPAYWMIFAQTAKQFFLFLFILFMNCEASSAICYIIAMFSTNMIMASGIFVAVFLFCLLFSGALIYPVDVNKVIVRFSYLNYAIEGLIDNEFRFDNSTAYQALLDNKGFADFLWGDVGVLIGLEVALHIGILLATKMVKERR